MAELTAIRPEKPATTFNITGLTENELGVLICAVRDYHNHQNTSPHYKAVAVRLWFELSKAV